MRKLMVAIGCCMVCLMFIECDPPMYCWFTIENKSVDTVDATINLSSYRYPDTSSVNLLNDYFSKRIVPPNTSRDLYKERNSLLDHYSMVISGVMSIYIFSKDTINKYSWKGTLASGRVLQRYDLSYKDIESLGFVIPYPPTEAMRDMKMWPRYKSEVE